MLFNFKTALQYSLKRMFLVLGVNFCKLYLDILLNASL